MSGSYHYATRYTAPSPQPRGDVPPRLPSLRDLDFGRTRRAPSPVSSPVPPPSDRHSWSKPAVPNSWPTQAPPAHQAQYSPTPDVTYPDTHYPVKHGNSYMPSTPSTSSQRSPPPLPPSSLPSRQDHPQYTYPPPSRPARQRETRPTSGSYSSPYPYPPHTSSQPPPPYTSYRAAAPSQAPPPPPPSTSVLHTPPTTAHGQPPQPASVHAHAHSHPATSSHAPQPHVSPPSSSTPYSNGYHHHEQYPARPDWPAHASPVPQQPYRPPASSSHAPHVSPSPLAPPSHDPWARQSHLQPPPPAPPAAHYDAHMSRHHPPPPPTPHQTRGPPPPPPVAHPVHQSYPPAHPVHYPYPPHPASVPPPAQPIPPAQTSPMHAPLQDHVHAPPHMTPVPSHSAAPPGLPPPSNYEGASSYSVRTASPIPPEPYHRGSEARAAPAPSPQDAILRQLIDHCTVLYQFAMRFSHLQASLPHMKPGPEELSQMNRRAEEVVRLLGDLRSMSLTETERAKLESAPSFRAPEEHRVPKRPWEDMDRDSDAGQDELHTDSAPEDQRSMAERDMETIRSKRASTTAGNAANISMPKTKYRKRSRASPPGKCHSCNIRETPEWRRGPDGARTLCNACGLHYAKLMRKRSKQNNGEPPHIDLETLRASARAADVSDKFARPKTASKQAREEKEKEAEALAHHQTSFQVPLAPPAHAPLPPPLTVPEERRERERVVPPPPASAGSSQQGSPALSRSSVGHADMHLPPPPPPPSFWASAPRTSGATRELRYVDSGPPSSYARSSAKS